MSDRIRAARRQALPGIACILGLAVAPALAQTPCGPHKLVAEMLSRKYGETLRSWGVGSGKLVETFASDEHRTWTIVVTMPDGMACVIAAGDAWETVKPTVPGEAL